jgi:aromatic ring hydroxylase
LRNDADHKNSLKDKRIEYYRRKAVKDPIRNEIIGMVINHVSDPYRMQNDSAVLLDLL